MSQSHTVVLVYAMNISGTNRECTVVNLLFKTWVGQQHRRCRRHKSSKPIEKRRATTEIFSPKVLFLVCNLLGFRVSSCVKRETPLVVIATAARCAVHTTTHTRVKN